jgi:hypothetical protein
LTLNDVARLPLPEPTGKPKEADWAWIEHEYRNGARSVREIARDAGISQPAISKRARREGWTREVITPVITEVCTVITPADNQPDNQADNQKGAPLAEPGWAGRDDDAYWRSEAAREDIVAHEQQTIAVYVNERNQLVIRAERNPLDDNDTFIVIDKAHAPALLRRIGELVSEPKRPN